MKYSYLRAILLPFLLVAPLLVQQTASAAESYDSCTGFVTSVPVVLNTPGTWCLNKNLSTAMTSGNAITILADNVVVDCNDFKVDGLAAGAGTRVAGISAYNRLNSTVRNCDVRGFYVGIVLVGSGHVVEDNHLDGNTFVGINVHGDGSVIRHNQVFDTGGSTVSGAPWGIIGYNSVDILDNTSSSVVATTGMGGNAVGIYTNSNFDGSVNGNRVRGLLPDGGGFALAVINFNSGRIALRNNDLAGNGSPGSTAFQCTDSKGRVKENVINGFVTAISRCGDGGGNDIAP